MDKNNRKTGSPTGLPAQYNRRELLHKGTLLSAGAAAWPLSSLTDRQIDDDQESSNEIGFFDNYEKLDGIGLAELVRSKQVSPEELLETALHRMRKLNPHINAIVDTCMDQARQAIKQGLPQGPFTGVPFLLKDISFPMKGCPSSYGSNLFANRPETVDSTAVKRYREAGLVLFGRTRVPELGILPTTESTHGGITRNPFDLERTAGGSSGGSAAAVAARIVPMASASDGGGSIRIPAACCGLFGLKPTRARVPVGPGKFESWGGLGTLHALTRSVRDSAALLDVAAGTALGDSYRAPYADTPFLNQIGKSPGNLKIGYVSTMPPAESAHPACLAACSKAAKLCTSLGHTVEDCTESFGQQFDFQRLRVSHGVTVLVAIRRMILKRLEELGRDLKPGDLEPVTQYYFDVAADYTGVQTEEARNAFFQSSRTMAEFQKQFDVILTPTLATPPIQHGRITLTGTAQNIIDGLLEFIPCTAMANWTGQPAMSVPLHQTTGGLPIGVQFMGRFGDESTLFRLASQLEAAAPWQERKPSISNNKNE